jgi:hypothetical protein
MARNLNKNREQLNFLLVERGTDKKSWVTKKTMDILKPEQAIRLFHEMNSTRRSHFMSLLHVL